MIEGWSYYNHAAIPNCAPHEKPDLSPVPTGDIWKLGGWGCLLARWTSDYDCGYETSFWYVIKDEPFDISSLSSKRRYEITKGNKYFRVQKIDPHIFADDILAVTEEAYLSWPKKYRPRVDEAVFAEEIKGWNNKDIFGCFSLEDNSFCGYAIVEDFGVYAAFSVLRVRPNAEKLAINAAMINGILEHYRVRLGNAFYICDGTRTIRHETAFQDYLEKYFGFRKAYCRLNIKYRQFFGMIVKLLYPIRNIIKGRTKIGNQILGILRMEEISRFTKYDR